ncbi:MAG: cell division protein ZapA [Acidobacteriaceae bacterium]|jgi:cell division protein ZapA|nr:cell division protein ZapA [Acidobacteriaceae bacterium]
MSESDESNAQAVSVDIYDQVYHLRGTDPQHIEKLASLVDTKMRAVSAQGSTVDSLRVAVLAALNIADELYAMRERYTELAGSMDQVNQSQTTLRSRADSLAGLLDSVLEERKAG